jgi:hypothetical protein
MRDFNNQQVYTCRCSAPVPAELKSVDPCVSHFTLSVERTCDEMHRQLALRQATVERQAEVATYMGRMRLAPRPRSQQPVLRLRFVGRRGVSRSGLGLIVRFARCSGV